MLHGRERTRLTGRVLTIAGVVAGEGAWGDFDAEWDTLLAKVGAKQLHMRDFAHSQGEYAGWSEEKRRQLLGGALDVITSKPIKEYGAWFELREWHAMPREVRAEYVDPWLVTAQAVMQALAAEPIVGDGQKIVYTFERKKELEYKAGVAFDLLKEKPDVPARDKMGGVGFEDKKGHAKLQAADLVAYELYKQIENILDGSPRADRYPLKRLMEHGFLSGRVFPMKLPSLLQALAVPIVGLG